MAVLNLPEGSLSSISSSQQVWQAHAERAVGVWLLWQQMEEPYSPSPPITLFSLSPFLPLFLTMWQTDK